MSEFYAYIAKNHRLIVRRSKGNAELQESIRNMKHYLGLFMANDMDHAREIAERLRDEAAWFEANYFAKEIVNNTIGGQL